MINVQKYLKNTLHKDDRSTYALVSHNGVVEAVYFWRFDLEGEPWYMEYPCWLETYKTEIENVEQYCQDFINDIKEGKCALYKPDDLKHDKFEQYLRNSIVGGTHYILESLQTGPFLPKMVDSIVLVDERVSIQHLLSQKQERK